MDDETADGGTWKLAKFGVWDTLGDSGHWAHLAIEPMMCGESD